MAPINKSVHPKHKGAVLIIAMVFVVIFSALAVSMATISGTNAQLASNQQKVDCALGSAESGLDVERYWLDTVIFPSDTPENKYFSTIMNALGSNMDANSITNIDLKKPFGTISPVTLDSTTGQTFSGQMSMSTTNPCILEVYSTGGNAPITRTIKVDYYIEPYEHPIFNYGLATKGPVNYTGNPATSGAAEAWEADIYIESSGSTTAMSVIGNTNFHGDIMIGNPAANASFGGDVLIDGDVGQDAIDNHVHVGVDPVDFPEPDTARFTTYATGDVLDSSTDLNAYGNELVNCSIAAGTNPFFPKSVIIKGILLIESPNVVTFSQNVALEGIIVGQGDPTVDPATDRIDFLGNFASGPYPAGVEFDAIRQEEGTSIVAPGFAAVFGGNFSTLEGVIALSGVLFTGNVNAQIKGTIINYSETPMIIEGNATMTFDRADSIKVPAGFDTLRVLNYDPSSYDEIVL
ncbi:MAG: pilus assembly PilX N-terminal domain-containing protein [Planctomycetota bacterium]|jgi:Tfp pilus assembly protein PilX